MTALSTRPNTPDPKLDRICVDKFRFPKALSFAEKSVGSCDGCGGTLKSWVGCRTQHSTLTEDVFNYVRCARRTLIAPLLQHPTSNVLYHHLTSSTLAQLVPVTEREAEHEVPTFVPTFEAIQKEKLKQKRKTNTGLVSQTHPYHSRKSPRYFDLTTSSGQ